jgi:hypothetical protein
MCWRVLWAINLGIPSSLGPTPLRAGPANPDISVLGQPFTRWTNTSLDASSKRVVMDQGEVEAVSDDYLTPYAKGYFVTSLGSDGFSLEEGYFTPLRGLPGGLQVKEGKYRVNLGKLNSMHSGQQHMMSTSSGNAVPAAERFPTLLRISASGTQRSPTCREAGPVRSYLLQEARCA